MRGCSNAASSHTAYGRPAWRLRFVLEIMPADAAYASRCSHTTLGRDKPVCPGWADNSTSFGAPCAPNFASRRQILTHDENNCKDRMLQTSFRRAAQLPAQVAGQAGD